MTYTEIAILNDYGRLYWSAVGGDCESIAEKNSAEERVFALAPDRIFSADIHEYLWKEWAISLPKWFKGERYS